MLNTGNYPSAESALFWVDLEKNQKPIKTITHKHKIYSQESYAQSLYDMYIGIKTTQSKSLQVNEVYQGRVISINNRYVLVDINDKNYIEVPNNGNDAKIINDLKIDSLVWVAITKIEDNVNYNIYGSFSLATTIKSKELMTIFFNDKTPIVITVQNIVNGGYNVICQLEDFKVNAFLPHFVASGNKLVDQESILGTSFEVLIDSYSQEKNQWIVSRKAYLDTLIPDAIKKLKIDGETIYKGFVTGTTNFGIFVEFADYPCLTGMIHKANLNPLYLDVYDRIVPGTEVDFYIKEVIKGNKPILTQIIRQTIWDEIKANKIKVGSTLTGVVKEEKPFGILVQLDEETLGLIHTSEYSKFQKMPTAGDEITVKIFALNRGERKIHLTV